MDDGYKHPVDEKKVKFKPNILSSRKGHMYWLIIITIISFFLSSSLLLLSSKVLKLIDNSIISLIVVLIIIVIGIIFDTIGVAVAVADEAPFHSMASRKLYGAKQSIWLIRNANKVSSFCNDVVGDICGVISGAASAIIIYRIAIAHGGSGVDSETTLVGLAISGMVASVTVGGKAMGKTIAIENSNYIVYKVSVISKFLFGKFNFKSKKKKIKKGNK
jgi:hypothetical protein